jgi:hypothetical protein
MCTNGFRANYFPKENYLVKNTLFSLLNSLFTQLFVSCGGGHRPVNGLRQQHVHTIRLLVWDTLEDFTAILTSYMGRRQ